MRRRAFLAGSLWLGLLAKAFGRRRLMSYTASAVHFGGSTHLINNSLTSIDNGKLSMSVWFANISNNGVSFNPFFVTDPLGNYNCYAAVRNSAPYSQPQLQLAPGNFATQFNTSAIGLTTDTHWHHLLLSYDSTVTGNPSALYVDGDLLTTDVANVTTIAMNALACYVAHDGTTHLIGDIADLWIACGTSLLNVQGLIPSATQAMFVDGSGRPLAPSSYPAGATVLFSGNSAGFPTNQGSGGSFTLTGMLSNAATNPTTGAIGFTNRRNCRSAPGGGIAGGGAVPQAGWSDPQSNFAYIMALDGADNNFTVSKTDRTTNTVTQTAVITNAPPPSVTSMFLSGFAAPWSDSTRMFAVGTDGSNNWYVITVSRSTLLPTHTALVRADATRTPANHPSDVSCSADGAYVVTCANSSVIPVAGQSHVSVYRSSNDGFALTTATSLGITTDSFESSVMDASNNIYCLGQSGKLYKLTFDTVTLAVTLAATYDLTGSLPVPVTMWAGLCLGYRQSVGTLLCWFQDSGNASSWRLLEVTTTGTVVKGPTTVTCDGALGTGGELVQSPTCGWTNATQFLSTTNVLGFNGDFHVLDITTGVTTTYLASLWSCLGNSGLSVVDPGTKTFWVQELQMGGTNLTPQDFAVFFLPGGGSSTARSFSHIFGNNRFT